MTDDWQEYKKLPRYVVSLQQSKECYKDFHECNTFVEAKEVADKKAQETGRGILIFDRKEFSISYRVLGVIKEESVVSKPVELKEKKVKRK